MTDTSTLSFLRSMLSESDGSVSNTRVCITCVFTFIIGIGITLVTKLHTPVTVADINGFLSTAGMFIATTCGPLYTINKLADIMNNKTDAISTKQIG